MNPVSTFKGHIEAVERLMNFDRDVLDIAITQLSDLRDRLKQHHKLDNPQLTAERTLEILRGIRQHDSLRPRYSAIFNQALVLLVSYFGSTVHDLFRQGIERVLDGGLECPLLAEGLRITMRDVRDTGLSLRQCAPDLFIQAKDISFQDMQSIVRAFGDHLEVRIERCSGMNDIIVAQACRHVIVHCGGLADDRLVKQVNNANPRDIKRTIDVGAEIQFTDIEVSAVGAKMLEFLQAMTDALEKRITERGADQQAP